MVFILAYELLIHDLWKKKYTFLQWILFMLKFGAVIAHWLALTFPFLKNHDYNEYTILNLYMCENEAMRDRLKFFTVACTM